MRSPRWEEREGEIPFCWANSRLMIGGGIGIPGSTASQYTFGISSEFGIAVMDASAKLAS